MARISGVDGIAYIGTTAAEIVKMAEWAVDMEAETVDSDPIFQDTWGDSWISVLRYTMSVSGSYDNADDSLYDAAIDYANDIKFYLYPDAAASTKYWYGTVRPTAWNITTPASGMVTLSMSGRGHGALGQKP